MKTLIFLSGFFLLFLISSNAQSVKVMTVADFKENLTKENDTLYVYNFWATWCRPCVAELPYFEKLQAHYADEKVKVVFVSLDFPENLNTQMKVFLEKRKLKSEVWLLSDAHESSDWIDQIHADWSGSIPATVLNMPSQDVYAFKEQSFDYEELEAWIEESKNNEQGFKNKE